MLTLYVKPGCPFCARVLRTGEELGLTFDLKSSDKEGVVDELIERGGKHQFPYLIDSEHDVEMYESDDIIDYLHQHYA